MSKRLLAWVWEAVLVPLIAAVFGPWLRTVGFEQLQAALTQTAAIDPWAICLMVAGWVIAGFALVGLGLVARRKQLAGMDVATAVTGMLLTAAAGGFWWNRIGWVFYPEAVFGAVVTTLAAYLALIAWRVVAVLRRRRPTPEPSVMVVDLSRAAPPQSDGPTPPEAPVVAHLEDVPDPAVWRRPDEPADPAIWRRRNIADPSPSASEAAGQGGSDDGLDFQPPRRATAEDG